MRKYIDPNEDKDYWRTYRFNLFAVLADPVPPIFIIIITDNIFQDNGDMFAAMEKTKLQIFNGIQPEVFVD